MRFFFAFALALFVFAPQAKAASAYDRIMESGTIRCGYALWDPAVMKAPNTGTMTGTFVEYMNILGKITDLKIEWTQEVDWGQVPEALRSGKIDAMCASFWPSSKKGKYVAFTKPVYYSIAEAYGRADESRFQSLSQINSDTITISVIDNDISDEIADFNFPKAKKLPATQLVSDVNLLMDVAAGKSDVTFTSEAIAQGFDKQNPGKIKKLFPDHPVRIFENTIGIDIHEQELLSLLNTATTELLNSGVIDDILDRYDVTHPGSFRRVAAPYR